MDIVNSVRECLKTWTKGGDAECRKLLLEPHSNPTDSNCVDILTTAYHTLLCGTLTTWTPNNPLTPAAFVEFVTSIVSSLPSSSTSSKLPSNAAIFGESLVDMIWSLDTELDELLSEARIVSAATVEQTKQSPKDLALLTSKAKKAQQAVEHDKQRIPVIVRKLLENRIISPDHCRERLETGVLAHVGLIHDKATQDKKEIRTRTGLFYKQNKFNLLREQSEGYSKLVVELTSSLGPSHSQQDGRPTEPYAVIEERARPVWEKVISLIGYFDLDPNRALDVILDVLSQHLTTHYSFFLALLSFSPWAGSYRRPLRDEELMYTTTGVSPGAFKGKNLDEVLTLVEENSLSGTAPSVVKGAEPRVLAQVLGFKFNYYQSEEVAESTPKNLYLTAAILIREGFITLEDLYPHLYPADEGMDAFRKEYDAGVKSRIAGAKNSLLAMAAPLESGSSSSSSQAKPKLATPSETKKIETKETNQKAALLTSLLAVGALKPSITLMTKFPWLVDAHPEVADLMLRVLKWSISPLYESLLITKERNTSFTHPKARYGPSGIAYPPPRKPLLTLCAPPPPSTNTTDFVFFFPDWVNRVPVSASLDDLEDVIEPLLRFVGVHVSRDPLFLTKFLRLGRLHMQSIVPVDPETKKPSGEADPNHPIRKFWFMNLRRYLLPALSLIRGNAVCTVEIWSIIRQYDTTARWRLYGEWKDGTYRSHPELRIRAVQADREAKGILRRLSLNTIDSLSGPVAKLAHSNPCILFQNSVHQIMAYENLANVVIQALRYVTNMGFDVLVFVILAAFANPSKDRVKDDGVNTSDWLQSLASFTGMLFRRYSADLMPVLNYITHQLHNRQSSEIIVLKELIWKMAGIEPLPSLSESQMSAMAGGPALRIEAIASETRGSRLDPSDAVLKGPSRLGKALLESKLALPLLVQVAQQRQSCVYSAPNTHLKSLSGLYDATHGVLLQYLELLTSSTVILPDDYANKVLPSLAELGQDYGICAPICMQIIRPVLHASLLASALALQEQEQRIASEEAEKRLKASLIAKREPNATASRVASPAVEPSASSETTGPKTEETDTTMDVDSTEHQAPSKEEQSPWLPQLEALFDDIKKIAPGNAYEVLGPGFYTTFWQLSMYDIAPPSSKYNEEGVKLRSLSRQEDSKYNAADRSADRTKRLTAAGHRTKRDRYTAFVNTLAKEFKEQTISRQFTLKRLAREKQHWFAHSSKALYLNSSFVENCIQPRCLLSPMDADFCAQFIQVMHSQGTPGFHTLGCYDKLLGEHVRVVVFSCSEYEAKNYGRFLCAILRHILAWHLDESAFIQDNRIKGAGGKTILLPGMQKPFSRDSSKPVEIGNLLTWPDYQKIVRKWYRRLAASFIDCIQTKEFMHVYNAIVVLKEILDVFPLASVNEGGVGINNAMDDLIEKEERGDLKILARSYSASLKKKEADWLPKRSHARAAASARPSPQVSADSANKSRGTATPVPTGPSAEPAASADGRRNGQVPASTPSAPRAIANNNAPSATTDAATKSISSAKAAMDSIPRPEVVKRVRPDTKVQESTKPDVVMSDASQSSERPRQPPTMPRSDASKEAQNGQLASDSARPESTHVMPPPAVPSQTASAQELRETARHTIPRSDKLDSRVQNGNGQSPRPRSSSPSSRPGTRNHSNDSRTSGGKSASNADRGSDDRRSDREGRQEPREPTGNISRRDSLTHTRTERRDREKEKDSDRDKDRGRDRHGGRDRDKDRDRDHRDRDRDREDRDRDRHRRDDKDRDRDSRKDRDGAASRSQVSSPAVAVDDRGLPTRPDTSRQEGSRRRDAPQTNGDDGLGKRRRPPDDEPERASKRSSRKDGHRDDRGRRPPEKDRDERGRDSDRRRKEREANDGDARVSSSTDKPTEKKLPEGSGKGIGGVPSGPRNSGRPKPEPAAPAGRDGRDSVVGRTPSGPSSQQQDSASRGSGSLRSRISEREAPSSSRGESSRHDDDLHRKRTLSDRDMDVDTTAPGPESLPPKRSRPNNGGNRPRHQQGGQHAVARRLLPIDHSGDRSQRKQD